MALAEQGIDPFGKRFDCSTNSAELKAQYEDKEKEELEELADNCNHCRSYYDQCVRVKQVLLDIQDREGQIQIYVRKDDVGEENYEIFKSRPWRLCWCRR